MNLEIFIHRVALYFIIGLFGIIASALALGIMAAVILAVVNTSPKPTKKDLEFERRLTEEIGKGNNLIHLSGFLPDAMVGFAWDEACRSHAYYYPEPVKNKDEWHITLRKHFGDKNHHKQRQFTAYLIDPLKFGKGFRLTAIDQAWCIDRSHAALQINESELLLIDERELIHTENNYAKPTWRSEWNNW